MLLHRILSFFKKIIRNNSKYQEINKLKREAFRKKNGINF